MVDASWRRGSAATPCAEPYRRQPADLLLYPKMRRPGWAAEAANATIQRALGGSILLLERVPKSRLNDDVTSPEIYIRKKLN